MILPITIYGNPVLRKAGKPIDKSYKGLSDLIENMWQTMYSAEGVGLAAPQIGKSIRLVVIDATPFAEDEPEMKDFKKVFINPEIIESGDKTVSFNEGCLSIPNIREDVVRPDYVKVRYQDENFVTHEEEFEGIKARVFQHELDHLDGKLFVDKISPIKRRLIKGKLSAIIKNKSQQSYRVLPNR